MVKTEKKKKKSVRCAAKSKKTGERCKNKTHITNPCCWTHTQYGKRGDELAVKWKGARKEFTGCAGVKFGEYDQPNMPISLRVKIEKNKQGANIGYGLFVEAPKSFKGRDGKTRKSDGAKLVFKKGDKVVVYSGELIDDAEHDKRYGPGDMDLGPYSLFFPGKYVDKIVDASKWDKSSVGRYANDQCFGAEGNDRYTCSNVVSKLIDNNLFLVAKKAIYDGDSISFSYGQKYWEAYLNKLKEEKKK